MSRQYNDIYIGSPEQLLNDCMTIPEPVLDLDGYYVCKEGFAIRPDGKVTYGSKTGTKGYYMIGNKPNRKYLHRAIAEAFIPNPDNLPMVRHLNDIPYDNSVENLAWGTQKDNMRDCINNGNFSFFSKEDIEKANAKRRTPIYAIFPDGHEEYYISQQEAARQLEINQRDIASVLCGHNKSSHGLRFRRA